MRRLASLSRPARVMVLAWLVLASSAEAPGGETPTPRGPAPLARYFPREDLVVYAEFDGVDAHAASWKKSAAWRMLNETTAGVMLEGLAAQLLNRAMGPMFRKPEAGVELVATLEHAFRAGFALGINRRPGEPRPICVGLVVRGAATGKVRETIEYVLKGGVAGFVKRETLSRPGGRRVNIAGERTGIGVAWWPEGDDLAISLVSPRGADVMIETLDGQRPDALEHPTRVALARGREGFEPVGLAFLDTAVLPPLPPEAAQLGLGAIKGLEYRWGFDGEAIRASLRVVAPAPRSGILAMFDQPALDARGLPPLAGGLDGFTVLSLEPARFLERLSAQLGSTDPDPLAGLEEQVKAVTGRRLREDILGHLGPRMAFSVAPTRINAPTNALAGLAVGILRVARATLLIEVDDPEAFGKVLDDVAAGVNRLANPKGPGLEAGAPAVEFRPLKGAARGYVVSVPQGLVPLPAGMRPTILLGRKYVILGTTPDAARRALEIEGRETGGPAPGDRLAGALDRLPKGMTFLTVSDERESFLPELIANLPSLAQLVAGGTLDIDGLLPALSGRMGRREDLPGLRQNDDDPLPALSGRMGRGPSEGGDLAFKFDPDQVPAPDDLRPFLFPASYVLAADDRGLEFTSREAFPTLNPTTAAPVALAMLLPAIRASRQAALRVRSTNNLKQIGLALHNFVSTNDRFPPVGTRDKAGKPLLSWRVAILPFLGEQALFAEFKLDEPWDSPHNKALLARMPAVYALSANAEEPGMTFYRGFSAKGTFFDDTAREGVRLAEIQDGTSNTVAVVEAREAVPWTRPDVELAFDSELVKLEDIAKDSLVSKLGGHFPDGFNALFADGSVRFLPETINIQILRSLITRAGGEVVSGDSF